MWVVSLRSASDFRVVLRRRDGPEAGRLIAYPAFVAYSAFVAAD